MNDRITVAEIMQRVYREADQVLSMRADELESIEEFAVATRLRRIAFAYHQACQQNVRLETSR